MSKHPIQPIVNDEGTLRFKENRIVGYLLERGPLDMNQLAVMDFSDEDRLQFAQLIGYSLYGSSTLSYMTDEVYNTAVRMAELHMSELEARIEYLEQLVDMLRDKLKEPMAELFEIHPSDLERA